MTADEAGRLSDPLAALILKRGTFPRPLGDLMNALDAFNNDPTGLPTQRVFIISEWGQIPLSPATQGLARQLRYVVARGKANCAGASLLVSTAPPSDDTEVKIHPSKIADVMLRTLRRLRHDVVMIGRAAVVPLSHCSTCASDQILRRTIPRRGPGVATTTIDKGDAIRENLPHKASWRRGHL